MAEAKGPPRKTTTYKEFAGMNSQDGRYGVEKDEFFFLENIMRVADGKLRSVPGPSAIVATFPQSQPPATGFLLLQDDFYLLLQDDGKIELQ